MAATVRVAAAQLGPASATRSATVARIVDLLRQAIQAHVDLLVFPELALTEYFGVSYGADVATLVEAELPSSLTQPIFDAIAQGDTSVVLPFAELDGEDTYNSAVLIDADGQVIGRYRKVHLPGDPEATAESKETAFEKLYFRPGNLGFPV